MRITVPSKLIGRSFEMRKRGMSLGFFVAAIAWSALALAWLPAACAETATLDPEQSSRLTDFLKSHRLPLVSAQVLRSPGRGQAVMLYGYTATEMGKSNAEKRTRLFLKDPQVPITNRIKVRPELASMRSPSTSSPTPQAGAEPSSPGQLGDVQSYQNQPYQAARQRYFDQQIQQYMNQQNSPSSLVNALIPLIALGLAIGLGGGFQMGMPPGLGPYGGYQSPYGRGCGPNPCNPNPYAIPGAGNP